MKINKITTNVSSLEHIDKTNEIIDNAIFSVNGLSVDASGNVNISSKHISELFVYSGLDVPAGSLPCDGHSIF